MASILNNSITLLEASQQYKEVLINQSTRVLSVFARGVQDKDITSPGIPSSVDDFYIVAIGAGGAWAGRDTQIALPAINSTGGIISGQWDFIEPITGLKVMVIDEQVEYYFNGTEWIPVSISYEEFIAITDLSYPMGGLIESPEDKTYPLFVANQNYYIDSFRFKSANMPGACTIQLEIDDVIIPSSNGFVTSTMQLLPITALNLITTGQRLTMTLSGTTGFEDLEFTITYKLFNYV